MGKGKKGGQIGKISGSEASSAGFNRSIVKVPMKQRGPELN